MADFEGFAFFCEDFRTEQGGKNSYMGVLGPSITIEPLHGAPSDAQAVIAKLVLVAMIRTSPLGDVPLEADVRFENAPDGVLPHLQTKHLLTSGSEHDVWMHHFNANIPNLPIKPGMKIIANFTVGENKFGTSLIINSAALD